MIRLFLVDDYAMLRAGLRALFQQQAERQVVGEAAKGELFAGQVASDSD